MKKKFFVLMLAVCMLLTMIPMAAMADTPAKVEMLTEGGQMDTDNNVTFGADTSVNYVPTANDFGRVANLWWVGIKVTAPDTVTEDNVANVKAQKKDVWWDAEQTWKDMNFAASKDGDFYIQLWVPVAPNFYALSETKDLPIKVEYQFDWNGDGVWDTETSINVEKGITFLDENGEQKAVITATSGQPYTFSDLLPDAVDAAATGSTLYLTKDAQGGGIQTKNDGKKLTIDFGGYTYTCGKPAAGSSNTKTQGCQILKDNTITLQNGTLAVQDGVESDVKTLIQNYGDLTIKNMTLDGTNLGQGNYNGVDFPKTATFTLNSYNGDVVLNNVKIKNSENSVTAYSIGCGWWPGTENNLRYPDGTTMTVDEESVFDNVLVYRDDKNQAMNEEKQSSIQIGDAEPIKGDWTGNDSDTQYTLVDGTLMDVADPTFVIAAPLANGQTPGATDGKATKYEVTAAAAKDGVIPVTVTAENLQKHLNGNNQEAYWVGVGVPVDGDGTGYTYYQGWTAPNADTTYSTNGLPDNWVTVNGQKYATFYFGAGGKTPGYVGVKKGDAAAVVYELDLSGVSFAVDSVALDQTELTLTEGDTATLKATIAPENTTETTVEWTSDKESVATVDANGKVTAVKAGEATITATIAGKTASAKVVVNAKPVDPVDPVDITKVFSDLEGRTQEDLDSIAYVYEKGLMVGVVAPSKTEPGEFAPTLEISRAMVVTTLYRLAGEPTDIKDTCTFTDIQLDGKDTWYTDAIKWAYAEKIAYGRSETVFDPNGAVTREEMVAFFARYEGVEKYDAKALDKFTDKDAVQDVFVDYMSWAVDVELIKGATDSTLNPAGNGERYQLANVLKRYCESILKAE